MPTVATQEQMDASPISKQLWIMKVPGEDTNLGIIESFKDFFLVDSEHNDPFIQVAEMDEKAVIETQEDTVNIMIDVSIAAICPNIYLFLEALYENKSKKVEKFHLSVYKSINTFINSDKNMSEQYPSIDRTKNPFTWTSDEEGYLINQFGNSILKFENPLVAKFVSLAGSQFQYLDSFLMQDMLESLGGGMAIFSNGAGGISMGLLSDHSRAASYESYLKMKAIVEELEWDLHAKLLKINNTLEEEYNH